VSAILIVDDEEILARAAARFLDHHGHACSVAFDAEEARRQIHGARPDLVLLDMRLGDDDGIAFLGEIHDLDPTVPVIIMTAYGSVETAVRAMKAGALDYFLKPVDLEELALIVGRALGEARTRERLERLERSHRGWRDELELIGGSPAMRAVLDFINRTARFDGLAAGDHPTILLLGETGTGKGLVARTLHARSGHAREAFLALDCTALPQHLIEAELFGYERGAFTDAKAAKAGLVEVAAGGTLFLDEIAELGVDAQSKLLRLIEEKRIRRIGGLADTPVDVRVIAATNRDLGELASGDRFRKDLLYRLNVLMLTLPPLRERGDDAQLLAEHFLRVYVHKYGRAPKTLSPSAIAAIAADPWVGNVRELAHAIERAVLLADGDTIEAEHLARTVGGVDKKAADGDATTPAASGGTLENVERQLIVQGLERSAWNVSLAARRLGVSREVLRYRMHKYGITPPADED
jgi:DNA-binding NtrC family response regulator